MKRIRGGSGLGDSLYLRPIVEALLARGEQITALTNYGDIFAGTDARVERYRRDPVDMIAHYVGGKRNPNTNIWQDITAAARIEAPLEFRWTRVNEELCRSVRQRAGGRPVILVHGGREPMGRRDHYGRELLPEEGAFRAALRGLEGCFTVRVGRDDELYRLPSSLDLFGKTSVSDLMDLAQLCDGVIGQCSFAIPLAEGFNKPALFVWAARGLCSANPFISTVTPVKMLSKPTSLAVMDDGQLGSIEKAARSVLGAGEAACAS